MVETDEAGVFGVICRELLGLGFPSAVLTARHAPDGPHPPYQYAHTSFSDPVQRATERILGRPLAAIRIDPASAPLVARVLRDGRTIHTGDAHAAARQLLGELPDDRLRRLERLLGLRHVVLAPLRYRNGISGLLVVTAARLRRTDPRAIDSLALSASIALEKAHLFSELHRQQARLESEVQRRTRELTHALNALREIDRRKDNFLANVSHELRTPLVTVLGYTDLLLSEKLGELTDRQRDCLKIATTSARRLRSFIEELLEYSRYELTREQLRFAQFDLPQAVHQAIMAVAPQFHLRGLLVRVRVARGTPPVMGDRQRVLQVLTNLLLNAERHAVQARHVRVAVAPQGPGRVGVSVTDDGPGIPPEHLDRIFDRLYQVGDAAQPREKSDGLGLGLAIARSIVEAHGGRIGVRSRVGRGTRFRFSLPAALPRVEQGVARGVTTPVG